MTININKHVAICFCAILMNMFGLRALAYDAKIDGIYYDFSSYSATVTMGDEPYSGNVVIPDYVTYGSKNYHIYDIGTRAFENCNGLITVTLPSDLSYIHSYAFSGCANLSSVTLPSTLIEIQDYAFAGCTNLSSIAIPEIVMRIGTAAFEDCSGLSSVNLSKESEYGASPELSIERSAFDNCSALASIIIPSRTSNIHYTAFSGCSSLESIIVESGNTKYDSRNNCNAIIETSSNTLVCGCKKTTIPSSVTTIGELAFWKCNTLTAIVIPQNVTNIQATSFYECSAIENIIVESGNTKYDSRNDCNAIIETSSNTLVCGCKNTIIPSGVTTIGKRAFMGCSALTSLSIPYGVTSIESHAFDGCSLQSVTIPSTLSIIGTYAFYDCKSLTSISLPYGVAEIQTSAFARSGLSSVTLPESVTTIGDWTFGECGSLVSIFIPSSVTSVGEHVVEDCPKLNSVTVDNTNTKYDSRNNCNGIIETSSNTLLFGCKNSVISNSVTAIGNDAFNKCTGLSSIVIPNSVTAIGWSAFSGTSLTSVEIPSNVTIIRPSAFACDNLTSVTIRKDVPISIDERTFSNRANATLYVPAGSVDTYKAADYWKEFKEIKAIEEKVAVTGVTLSESSITFKRIGKTKQLIATVLPEDATNKGVNWMSATPTVCSVSETGLVTALGSGNGIVIATTVDGGKMAYCTVNVTPTDHATITMGSNGIATFSDEDALDFTSVSGLKAYIGSGYNPATGDLTMTRVYKVPAGEGLLVKGAAGSYEVPYEETSAYYANLLVGVPTAMTVNPTDGDYTNFILANDEVKGIGFYPLASAGEIGANKAYLQLPTSILPAASRSLRMVFEDEEEDVTRISEECRVKSEESVFFDLQGRRIAKPTKAGLYVKDGRKVLVK